ncbi:MAG: Bifunctional (p)ppGpp synthase/hydrolase RelA [Chloroflexi bacterium ADurb.Bin344]|nr:MAG: Bifunctional (p)ppGpp synthase/hydrolase RelA [Chloroflexi bacterium ADurb.Bin344]
MLLDDLLAGLPDNYTQADKDLVEKAYYFAEKAHEGQKRASGEPYFTHCVAVAMILSELKVQSAAIAAGLLHDTVEDTNVTLEDIRANFGDEIAKLVDGVTKLTNIPKTNDYEKNFSPQNKIDNDPISVTDEIELGIQDSAAMRDRKRQLKNETLRKTFIAMVDDVRVIIIKLADRLHNMRTLSHVSKEKQKRIAQETLDIYAPLANRLGIWRIKWELEDLAFRYEGMPGRLDIGGLGFILARQYVLFDGRQLDRARGQAFVSTNIDSCFVFPHQMMTSDSASHSSGTIVGCVVGDSEYVTCTPPSPPPGLRGVILNAKRNE